MNNEKDSSAKALPDSHKAHTIDVPEDLPQKRTNYRELDHLRGTETGERQRATVPGGWEGTDDATSTAASDIPKSMREEDEPNISDSLLVEFPGKPPEGTFPN